MRMAGSTQRLPGMDGQRLEASLNPGWLILDPWQTRHRKVDCYLGMKFLFQKMQRRLKRSHDQLVLSFFFNARGSDLKKSTLGLYRSLLLSMLSSNLSLLQALDHCSRSQYLGISSGGWEQNHEPLYKNFLRMLSVSLQHARKGCTVMWMLWMSARKIKSGMW